jgi:hypothetical protein
VSENKVRKEFAPKKEEVGEKYLILHKENIRDLYGKGKVVPLLLAVLLAEQEILDIT